MDYIDFIDAPVARNLDAFLAHWDGKMPFDELLTALRGPAAQNTKKKK